jgi:indolepyruvate ferredoxin oxidoreductase
MVAASWAGLAAADPRRTSVVGSVDLTPPGKKVAHPEIEMPTADELLARVAAATLPERRHWADAAALASALVGDTVASNIFVVGMAVQSGLLPLRASSVEEAIALNGVAVERNQAAFRWGRLWITDPEKVEAAAEARQAPKPAPPTVGPALKETIDQFAVGESALHATLVLLTADLAAFQNEALARRYLDDLQPVRAAELAADPTSDALTEAAARGLHKLLAYKDEYEVARLLLAPEAGEAIATVASGGERVGWKLHPPFLRALGRKKKITMSTGWGRPVMQLLASARRLRGTALDPFGRAEVRRVERELAGEYLEALGRVIVDLDADGIDTAIGVAVTPELVRGYEDIKLANVVIFRERLAELTTP